MSSLRKIIPKNSSDDMLIKSPLTNGPTKWIGEFNTADIIEAYKEQYNIDIRSYFEMNTNLNLYKCQNSGYEFYHPFNIAGKDDLYKQLAVFDWYYIPWKWEYKKSLSYVSKSMSILEIGCGSGLFLKNIQNQFPDKNFIGLEITVNDAPEKFINNQTIQEHVKSDANRYDLVCSYQVLEHIADVNSFLQASITALNPGGKLILSMPNNDSIFFKRSWDSILNMPPHHMGLWNNRSLEYLTKQYPLKLVKKYFEPIQDYHFEWFKNIIKRKFRLPLLHRIVTNPKVLHIICKLLRKFYRGHSFMFVFEKI